MNKPTPRQYKPFNHKELGIPIVVYPVKDENPLEEVFDKKDSKSIIKHLDNLYKKNEKVLSKGQYYILFVWNLGGHRMTDVWMHNMKNWSARFCQDLMSHLPPFHAFYLQINRWHRY